MKFVPESINEAVSDVLKPKDLSPQETLQYACTHDDLESFKRALRNGAKFTYSIYRKMETNWRYNSPSIKEYLQSNPQIIEEIAAPKDLEKLKSFFSITPESQHQSYPRGYKQYRVLKYVDDGLATKRMDLIKLIYELGYGPNTFNPLKNASYWSTNYMNVIGQYLKNVPKGQPLELNNAGKNKLREIQDNFKDLKITPYV